MQMQMHFVEHNFAKCKCKCILWNTALQNANANAKAMQQKRRLGSLTARFV